LNWRTRPLETYKKSTITKMSYRLMFPMAERLIQISAISGHPFQQLAYNETLLIFSTSLYQINQLLRVKE